MNCHYCSANGVPLKDTHSGKKIINKQTSICPDGQYIQKQATVRHVRY